MRAHARWAVWRAKASVSAVVAKQGRKDRPSQVWQRPRRSCAPSLAPPLARECAIMKQHGPLLGMWAGSNQNPRIRREHQRLSCSLYRQQRSRRETAGQRHNHLNRPYFASHVVSQAPREGRPLPVPTASASSLSRISPANSAGDTHSPCGARRAGSCQSPRSGDRTVRKRSSTRRCPPIISTSCRSCSAATATRMFR